MNQNSLRQFIDAFCAPGRPIEMNLLKQLSAEMKAAYLDCSQLEMLLRQGPILNPQPEIEAGQLYGKIPLQCIHLNYQTSFFLYLPTSYQANEASPLIIIGHGGNGSMNKNYAESTAHAAIKDWIPIAEEYGFILAAPATSRGWGNIGYSIIHSLRSLLQRWFRLHPDRMYLTGHSMGGHLSWRSAIYIGDWWGAVAPMSGGYDYVEKGLMSMLYNVPGYVTFGRREPYGIAESNRNMQSWLQANDFEWIVKEKAGGHEIFHDELPNVASFFLEHPRNLYRTQVWGEAWHAESWHEPDKQWMRYNQWHPQRPIPNSVFHWLRLYADKSLPVGKRQKVFAWVDHQTNHIFLEAENCKKALLYLHPNLIDFDRDIVIVVNGERNFQGRMQPDMATMLDTVREFDDWGRIFWAKKEVRINTSQSPTLPRGFIS